MTKPVHIRKWVLALRSGKYKQAREALVRMNKKTQLPKSHCCLGVACEVYIKTKKLNRKNFWRHHKEGSTLPHKVAMFFGLMPDPKLEDSLNLCPTATTMNDERRSSFKNIANAVERAYLK